MQLKLSENKISGNIPQELSSCTSLVSLNLSHNQLNGQIPSSLSKMPVLGQLDLSVNQLSGEIPRNLGQVESLVQVNVSHNRFHGHLPSTGAFLAINSSAVVGNHLCGGDATTGLPPCKGIKTPVWWLFVTCTLVFLAILILFSFLVVCVRQRRDLELELKRVENEDGVWELEFFDSKTSREIKVDDVLLSMRDENVISRGRRGVSFKGTCARSNMQFFIKEICETSSGLTGSELGKLRHPNIVKLIATCRFKKSGFFVYEYV